MFLGAYHFEGDPRELTTAFDRLLASFPENDLLVNICVTRPDGMTVFDACPSQAVFQAFSTSAGFAAAIAGAGLPRPRVEQLGEIHHVIAPVVTRT